MANPDRGPTQFSVDSQRATVPARLPPEIRRPRRTTGLSPRRILSALVHHPVETTLTFATIVGAGAVVDRFATGRFPWESSSRGGIDTPGKTPEPINSAEPTVTIQPETPTPTPEATTTSTSTPEATSTPTPEPTKSPEIAQLEKNIQEWTAKDKNGNYVLKFDKYDQRRFTWEADGNAQPFNIIPNTGKTPGKDWWFPYFHGYLLGSEEVKDANGTDHLIAYIGQEDGNEERYFIPINIGILDSNHLTDITQDPKRRIYTTIQDKLFNLPDTEKIMQRLIGETILFSGGAYKFPKDGPLMQGFDKNEFYLQQDVMIELANFSLESRNGSYKQVLKKYPLVERMINKRISEVDPSKIPYIFLFKVPIDGLY